MSLTAPTGAPLDEYVDASLELKDINPREFEEQQADFKVAVASVGLACASQHHTTALSITLHCKSISGSTQIAWRVWLTRVSNVFVTFHDSTTHDFSALRQEPQNKMFSIAFPLSHAFFVHIKRYPQRQTACLLT